jgi:hypothetical protein
MGSSSVLVLHLGEQAIDRALARRSANDLPWRLTTIACRFILSR